jgi:hypothetical protein
VIVAAHVHDVLALFRAKNVHDVLAPDKYQLGRKGYKIFSNLNNHGRSPISTGHALLASATADHRQRHDSLTAKKVVEHVAPHHYKERRERVSQNQVRTPYWKDAALIR